MFESDGNVSIPMVANSKGYVTATWKSGTSGYRKWSDGYIEQWGRVSTSTTVTLNTAFSNANYGLVIAQSGAPNTWSTNVSSLTATTFYIGNVYSAGFWYACGY